MRLYSRKRNAVKIFLATTIIAALIFLASDYLMRKANQVVIAKVNNQKIFKSEVERKLRSVFDQSQEVKVPEVENLPKEVIELLVKEIYLDKELTKAAKKSSASKSDEVKNKIADAENKIIRQAYVDSLLKAEITDQKINQKYLEISNEITGKKEYLVAHIVTKTQEEAEKLLKELKAKKVSPSKFAELAKKYSIDRDSADEGGSLGYLVEDNMIKEIADLVSSLKKDEISAPISTKFGWHLVRVSDVRNVTVMPFESVKENIRSQLIQDKISEINNKIAKDAKIQLLIELKNPEPITKSEEVKPAESAQPEPQVKNESEKSQPDEEKTELTSEERAQPATTEEKSAPEPIAQETNVPAEKTILKKDQKKSDVKADAKNKSKKSKER